MCHEIFSIIGYIYHTATMDTDDIYMKDDIIYIELNDEKTIHKFADEIKRLISRIINNSGAKLIFPTDLLMVVNDKKMNYIEFADKYNMPRDWVREAYMKKVSNMYKF